MMDNFCELSQKYETLILCYIAFWEFFHYFTIFINNEILKTTCTAIAHIQIVISSSIKGRKQKKNVVGLREGVMIVSQNRVLLL